MPIFYQSYLDQLSGKSINAFCRKCPDYGDLCDLTNGSCLMGPESRFCECEYLQENF